MEFTVLAFFHIPEAEACVCVGGFLGYINHILSPLLFADWYMDYCNKIISNLKSKDLLKNCICLRMLSIMQGNSKYSGFLLNGIERFFLLLIAYLTSGCIEVMSWKLIHYVCSVNSKANAYTRAGQWDINIFMLG